MLICITGSGYVSKKAAQDLITDFIEGYNPDRVTFMLPSYLIADGIKNVRDVVKDTDHVIVSYKRTVMPEMFRTYQDSHKVVFILDADTDREFLVDSDVRELAYDLSRGLYPAAPSLAQDTLCMAPGATETDEQVQSGMNPYPYGLSASDLLTELSTDEDIIRANWIRYFDKCTLNELKGLEEEVRHAVHVRERDMHPVYTQYQNGLKINGTEATAEELDEELGTVPVSAGTVEAMIHSAEVSQHETVKYWKSKTGKYRKAGRSKSRPGETEIFLNQEEIDKIDA